MTKYNILQPDKKYSPLPLDKDGKLLEFIVSLDKGDTIEGVLEANGLMSQYYKCTSSSEGVYIVKGHYMCPP